MSALETLAKLEQDFQEYATAAKRIEKLAQKYRDALQEIANHELKKEFDCDDYTGCPGTVAAYDEVREIAEEALKLK
jgi:DNA-binding ferritin-like protein (Dps family)